MIATIDADWRFASERRSRASSLHTPLHTPGPDATRAGQNQLRNLPWKRCGSFAVPSFHPVKRTEGPLKVYFFSAIFREISSMSLGRRSASTLSTMLATSAGFSAGASE